MPTKIMATDQYIERLGSFATPAELKHIVTLASLPPKPGEVPSTAVVDAIIKAAENASLPTVHGHYGMDLETGEFLRSV